MWGCGDSGVGDVIMGAAVRAESDLGPGAFVGLLVVCVLCAYSVA